MPVRDPTLGAPTGTVPRGRIGGGGPWDLVNRFDAIFAVEGAKHGVPPAMLKAMMIVETGGKNVADPFGASGVMQIKRAYWDGRARTAGYDLGTDAGQIGMAAAIVGGSVPGVPGATPTERFLSTYYPIAGGLDAVGESGHTQRMYLEDIALYTRLIEAAGGTEHAPVIKPVIKSTPGPPVFGRVPAPANFSERLVLNSTAWDDLGPRVIRFFCLHRMIGSLSGTDGYFRGPAAGSALTDFGIGRGLVYQWNALNRPINGHWRAPWANGPADDVEGDGVAVVRRYGVAGVNRDGMSIEIEGNYDSPLPAADEDRIVELLAWGCDQITDPPISYLTWPRNNDGIHCLLGHFEFGPKACPGPVVLGRVSEIIRKVGIRLRQYQGGDS